MTKNCINSRQRSHTSESRDHKSFKEPKNLFTQKRIVKIGLCCDGMFVDMQICPLEIFAITKPKFFSFLE